jgi:rhamnosyltransferase
MQSLTVLLVTKNGRRDLERVLPALFAQKNVGTFEVLAVDSGSTDGTLELLRQYPIQLSQIAPKTFHHAQTRNLAAEQSTGEILIFLSQDAVPASDSWLSKMISNFDDPAVAAVYGRQLARAGCSGERNDTFDLIYGPQRLVKDPARRNGLGYRFYHFSNVNAAIRRSVWEQTRFPEDMKVFEDLGIAKRILDNGWKIVYEPEAAVLHSHNHSAIGLFKRYFDIGYTLQRLKIWEAPGTKKSLLRDAWTLLRRKAHHTRSPDRPPVTGNGVGQDIAKSLGLLLGLNQGWLPVVMKRHLSAFQVFD